MDEPVTRSMARINQYRDWRTASCRVCNDYGTVVCPRCEGSGKAAVRPSEMCPYCVGTGVADCPNCGILAQEPPVQETGGGSPDAVLAAQDIRQRVSFLGQVEIFQHLSKATLERLASRVRSVSLVDGHIFEENEPTDGLYIITSGMVRVTKPAGTGEVEVDLATLTRGDFFGEIGLIDGLPRSAKVTAMQPTECYFLPRPVFLTALRESPEIALALLPALTRMVRSADVIAQTLLSMFLKDK